MSKIHRKAGDDKPEHGRSLLRRFIIQFITAMLVFALLLFGVFASLFFSFRNSSYQTVQDSLRFYDERISSELDANIKSLVGSCSSNPFIIRLRTTKDRNEEVSCIVNVQTLLSSQISQHSIIEGFYLYYPTKKLFLPVYQSGGYSAQKGYLYPSFIRDLLESHMENGVIRDDLPRNWFFIKNDNQLCLLRVFRYGEIYGGAWVDLDDLPGFSEFSGTEAIQMITDRDGQILYASSSLSEAGYSGDYRTELTIPLQESLNRAVTVRIPDIGRRVVVSSEQSFSDYCFTVLLPQRQFLKTLQPLLLLVLLLVIWGLFFFLTFSRMGRRILAIPTESLMAVTENIHRGNFESQVVSPNNYTETVQIIDAFNELISQIGELRIGIYEQQLQAREFELAALKNQVAPHFLINCLNTIFMSAQNPARSEMTSQIITTLSSHLRYTLSDRSIVPLSEELEYLENYILLTQYRYPETLSFELEAGQDVMEASVFPLILLTLTENSVKTGLIMGEPFLIRVEAEIITKNEELFVRLVHTDSGTGLSEENLEKYNHIFEHPEVTEKGTGIGLYNTALRLQLLLGDRAEMKFRNEEGMGLSVEITFPYTKYEEPLEEAIEMKRQDGEKHESADYRR